MWAVIALFRWITSASGLAENEASPAPAGGRRLRCRAAARRWREGSIMVVFELRLCAPLGPSGLYKNCVYFLKKIRVLTCFRKNLEI
jgi:hypothetical protein